MNKRQRKKRDDKTINESARRCRLVAAEGNHVTAGDIVREALANRGITWHGDEGQSLAELNRLIDEQNARYDAAWAQARPPMVRSK